MRNSPVAGHLGYPQANDRMLTMVDRSYVESFVENRSVKFYHL